MNTDHEHWSRALIKERTEGMARSPAGHPLQPYFSRFRLSAERLPSVSSRSHQLPKATPGAAGAAQSHDGIAPRAPSAARGRYCKSAYGTSREKSAAGSGICSPAELLALLSGGPALLVHGPLLLHNPMTRATTPPSAKARVHVVSQTSTPSLVPRSFAMTIIEAMHGTKSVRVIRATSVWSGDKTMS